MYNMYLRRRQILGYKYISRNYTTASKQIFFKVISKMILTFFFINKSDNYYIFVEY